MTTTASPSSADVSTPGRRIGELDALRGFALCGILVINIIQELVQSADGAAKTFPLPIQLIFFERFLVIFGVLFGIGFGLFLQRARGRTRRPRAVLGRRLVVLLAIGLLHFLVNPGDVLTFYAVFGLLVLIPVSVLSGRAALAVAVVLLLVLPQIQTSVGVIPGLLVLGYALAELGVPDGLARHPRRLAAGLAVFGTLAVVAAILAVADVPLPMINVLGGGLGGTQNLSGPLTALVTGLAYCCAVLLALRTAPGSAVGRVLAPMGRMALTNYLTATALFLTVGRLLGIDSLDDGVAIAGLTVGILVVQAIWSRWWLDRLRYGPAEWVWRCLTWWRRAPLRREATGRHHPATVRA
jgi:uncharacterized membrane protein YeiB